MLMAATTVVEAALRHLTEAVRAVIVMGVIVADSLHC